MANLITTVDQARQAGAYDAQYGAGAYKNAPTPPPIQPIPQATTPVDTSLNANEIGVISPYVIPKATTSTSTIAGAGIQGQSQGLNDSLIKEQQNTIDQQNAAVTEDKSTLKSYIDKLLGKNTEQAQLEQQAGIPDQVKQLNDITNEYNTKQLAFRRQEEAIRNNPALTKEQANDQVAEISRRNNMELADIAIRQSVASNNLTSAQNLINHKIDLEYGDLKDIIGYQTQFLKDNQDKLSKAEENKLKLKIEDNTRKYEEGVAAAKAREAVNLELIKASLKGGSITGNGNISSTAQAVIDNPNLLNSLTPTLKGQVISELSRAGYDTSTLGVKPLSDTAIKEVNQSNTALTSLNDLKAVIQNNLQYVGPISGFAALNPWSKARQVQAEIDRVKQQVGKALEGGVLRKEDEEKYKKILATINDTPSTAVYKIDNIIQSIGQSLADYQALQTGAGRSSSVTKSLQKKGSDTSGKTSTGNSYTITKE